MASEAERENARVLIFAPIGRDAAASAELMSRAGLQPAVCADAAELTRDLKAGAGAVFVAEEGMFGQDLTELAGWIANQPAWSDLPFVVLTSRLEQPAVAAWRQRMVAMLRNVSLLERPVQAITLTSTIHAAVRARLRQYEVRSLLEARELAAQELEQLVVARTSQLEAANLELRLQMEERAKVEESLRQAQKIEALGQLTGGVAHDFNNLLMVISGGLNMLDRVSDPKRRKRLMEGMHQAAQRGASLTRQLLAFSRRQPLAPESVDLARQIGGMRELLDRSLRGDVHVRLHFADDLWPVAVDPGELELMILNLAVNARDAMPSGGAILISAENAQGLAEGNVCGDFVRLTITDSGVGIPIELRDRVFDPFFTTKEIGRGSGLGLAQVHGFATQSGGAVRIESDPGQGTSVILLLPRSSSPAPVQERHRGDQPYAAGEPASAGQILLVEDDDEVASLVGEMLCQLGYSVIRAASASAALGALANGRSVDVVFSDIMMPGGMNGVELAREVRKRKPQTPVLLTSGYAEPAKAAADAEGVSILPKPYQLDELAAALSGLRQAAVHSVGGG